MEDWDLQAVVRGCTAATTASCCSSTSATTATTTTAATSSCSSSSMAYPVLCPPPSSFETPQQDGNFFGLQDLFFIEPRSQELHDLYKPFFPKSSPPLSPQNIPISPLSVIGGLQDLSQQSQQHQQQPKKQQQQQQVFQVNQGTSSMAAAAAGGSRSCGGGSNGGPPSHRSKRRKNQLKRVCQVPAEALSSDSWSWRKYGQKPIKGSPYPRGYYRCSTSKGCMARKQVERNRSDPGMFIVTYTSEHNHPMPTHRNSLAGSSRNKPSTSQSANSGEPKKPSSGSPPVSPSASLSSAPEKFEVESSSKDDNILEDEEDDAVNGYEMEVDDDFFEGLEKFTGKSALVDVDSGSSSFPADHLNMQQFPWLMKNNVTTTSAAAAATRG